MIYYGVQVSREDKFSKTNPTWAGFSQGGWYADDDEPILTTAYEIAKMWLETARKNTLGACRIVKFEAKFPKARRK